MLSICPIAQTFLPAGHAAPHTAPSGGVLASAPASTDPSPPLDPSDDEDPSPLDPSAPEEPSLPVVPSTLGAPSFVLPLEPSPPLEPPSDPFSLPLSDEEQAAKRRPATMVEHASAATCVKRVVI